MVEPLDGTLKGGLLLQTGLVRSIGGRFEVTIINPTSGEVWLRSRSPVGRMYTVGVINRNPEHIVEFQELDDGLRVTMEPRPVTAFTRRISNQYDQNTQDTYPQEQEWMERVNIGTIPSAYQHQLVELLRSHQQVFAQDDDDVGLTQAVKHRIYTTDDSPVKAAYRRIPPPQFDEVKRQNTHYGSLPQRDNQTQSV